MKEKNTNDNTGIIASSCIISKSSTNIKVKKLNPILTPPSSLPPGVTIKIGDDYDVLGGEIDHNVRRRKGDTDERFFERRSKNLHKDLLKKREYAADLIHSAREQICSTQPWLEKTYLLTYKYGFKLNSSILDKHYDVPASRLLTGNSVVDAAISNSESSTTADANADVDRYSLLPLSTTGGHSNTDHLIQNTGDYRADRIAEYKRALKRRHKAMQPENRHEDRWDQAKAPLGSRTRRRRITRDKDLPSAPPEPPPSGYILFIAHRSAKFRYDTEFRPKKKENRKPVNLTTVIQKMGQEWNNLDADDKQYYEDFVIAAKAEYAIQIREFRATGRYSSSLKFTKKTDNGPWIRCDPLEKNDLESELDTYPIEVFQVRLDSRLKQDNSDNDDSDDSQSSDSSYSDSSSDEEEVGKDKNTRSTKKKSNTSKFVDFDFSRRNQPFNGIGDSLEKLASSYKNDNRYKKTGHEQKKGTEKEKEKAAEAKEEKEDEEAIDIAPPHFLFETDNTINNISNNIINKDIVPSIFDAAVPDLIVSAPQNNFAVSSLGDKNITTATNPILPSNNSNVMDNIEGSEFGANIKNFGDPNLETFDI